MQISIYFNPVNLKLYFSPLVDYKNIYILHIFLLNISEFLLNQDYQ